MAKKHFTYRIGCSFSMQFTFTESEVEQSDEGGEGDMTPTDKALEELCKEIEECLSGRLGGVDKVEAWTDFDDLLGVEED